jgi:hypothetical protein
MITQQCCKRWESLSGQICVLQSLHLQHLTQVQAHRECGWMTGRTKQQSKLSTSYQFPLLPVELRFQHPETVTPISMLTLCLADTSLG